MKKWTEAYVHLRMREVLKGVGFTLVAGEFPGGSDHELFPLNITDPEIAKDNSPDPRRHSAGELIPDIVALRDRFLVLGEAKVHYSEPDHQKLQQMTLDRRAHLQLALRKFAQDRGFPDLLPVEKLKFLPTLIFTSLRDLPAVPSDLSCIVLDTEKEPVLIGPLGNVVSHEW